PTNAPRTSAGRGTAPADRGVQVDPRRLVGHRVSETLQWLHDQGLRATVTKPTEHAAKDGTVKALMTASGHVLRAPHLLPAGSQGRVVAAAAKPDTHPDKTASHSANQHIVAGLNGLVDLTPTSSEQQGNR